MTNNRFTPASALLGYFDKLSRDQTGNPHFTALMGAYGCQALDNKFVSVIKSQQSHVMKLRRYVGQAPFTDRLKSSTLEALNTIENVFTWDGLHQAFSTIYKSIYTPRVPVLVYLDNDLQSKDIAFAIDDDQIIDLKAKLLEVLGQFGEFESDNVELSRIRELLEQALALLAEIETIGPHPAKAVLAEAFAEIATLSRKLPPRARQMLKVAAAICASGWVALSWYNEGFEQISQAIEHTKSIFEFAQKNLSTGVPLLEDLRDAEPQSPKSRRPT